MIGAVGIKNRIGLSLSESLSENSSPVFEMNQLELTRPLVYRVVMESISRDIVGALLVSSDRHILLGYKAQAEVHGEEGYWVLPGGGVERSETHLEALRREVFEELRVDIVNFEARLIDSSLSREEIKVLRGSDSPVRCKMRFFDFLVRTNVVAAATPFVPSDDLSTAEWVSLSHVLDYPLSESLRELIEKHLHII